MAAPNEAFRIPLHGGWAARLRVLGAANHRLMMQGIEILVVPCQDYTIDFGRLMNDVHRAEAEYLRYAEEVRTTNSFAEAEAVKAKYPVASRKELAPLMLMVANGAECYADPHFPRSPTGLVWNRLDTSRITELLLVPVSPGDRSPRIEVLWMPEVARL